MKDFTESDRYDVRGLTPESTVLDIGAYEGNWSRLIVEKYGCSAHLFEPIKSFHGGIVDRLKEHPQASQFSIHNFGVGSNTRTERMGVKGDMSGVVADGPIEEVHIIGITDLLTNSLLADKFIGCAKLNCEGGEYEILESLLDTGMISRIDTLHVQFHDVIPRAAERMAAIKNRMLITHRLIWDAPWCWTGWESKSL